MLKRCDQLNSGFRLTFNIIKLICWPTQKILMNSVFVQFLTNGEKESYHLTFSMVGFMISFTVI